MKHNSRGRVYKLGVYAQVIVAMEKCKESCRRRRNEAASLLGYRTVFTERSGAERFYDPRALMAHSVAEGGRPSGIVSFLTPV